MKKIFISALFFASQVFAADTVLNTNKVKVGQQTSPADKVIEFNTNSGAANPKIKVSPSTNKIQFSNDGTNFKDIGSGSGGGAGINLLAEPGFESGVTVGWSNTGGTFANVTTAPNLLFGTTSAAFTASATGQYFESTSIAIPEILKGQDCYVKVEYKGADSNYFLTVTNGTGTEIIPTNARATLSTATLKRDAKVYFTCPTTGSLKLRVQSTAAGVIGYFDQASLGQSDAVPYKQSQFLGRVQSDNITGCVWATTSTSFSNFAANASCNTATATGFVQSPLTKIPAVVIPNAAAGTYYFVATGSFSKSSNTDGTAGFRFSDGSISSSANTIRNNTSFHAVGNVVGELTLSSNQSNWTVNLQGITSSATFPAEIVNVATGASFSISVYYYPSQSDIVVNSKCLNPIDCENTFTAYINGSTAAHGGENLDWIDSCTKPSTGNYSCTIRSGIFVNSQPICSIQKANRVTGFNGDNSSFSITVTTISWKFIENNSNTDMDAMIICHKGGIDYKVKQEIKGFFSSMLSPVAFAASGNASQSIPNTTTTQVIISNEAYDTSNSYNPTTGIFVVPENGRYQCSCQVGIVGVPAGSFTIASEIFKNGSSVSQKWEMTSGANIYMPLAVGYESYVVGDQITCRTNQNTGASRTVDPNGQRTFFACNKVAN